MTRMRLWVVLADGPQAERTPEVDESAHACGWGQLYRTGEPLPEYQGVWLAPNGGHYHMFSDYPREQHPRFGWFCTRFACPD